MTTIPEALKPAFLIYLKELETHIVFFRSLLNRKSTALSADDFLALHHRCHTIKGGAGFFQLDTLQQLGADGEKFFASHDHAEQAVSHLHSLTDRLEQAVNKLKNC